MYPDEIAPSMFVLSEVFSKYIRENLTDPPFGTGFQLSVSEGDL